MSDNSTPNTFLSDLGLGKDDLEFAFKIASEVCLAKAARQNLDAFPPGSGNMNRRSLHRRRERFENAIKILEDSFPETQG